MSSGSDVLAQIKRAGDALTKRQIAVLRWMDETSVANGGDDGELVYERGQAYIGTERTSGRTLFALLRAAAIHLDGDQKDIGIGMERYVITETGEQILRAHGIEPRPRSTAEEESDD